MSSPSQGCIPETKYKDTLATGTHVLSDGVWAPVPHLAKQLRQWLDTHPKIAQGQRQDLKPSPQEASKHQEPLP